LSSSDNPPIDPQFEPPPLTTLGPPVVPSIPPDSFAVPGVAPNAAPNSASAPAVAPPVRDPLWSGWDVLLIALLTFVAMVVLQIMVMVAAQVVLYPHSNLSEVGQKPAVLLWAQMLLYATVAAGMFLLVEGKYHVPFWKAIQWNWPPSVWRMLGVGALMMITLGLLQSVLPMPKDTPFEHLFDRPRDAYILSLIAVTIAPLMEEVFFRGLMYPVLARRMGVTWAIILSALPFGLIHLPQYGWAWAAGLVIFLVGVVCGVARAAKRSVGAAFLVHAGYNGTQMLIAILMTHGFRNMDKAVAGVHVFLW
jgi:membrane protease YdiL (CAAX protease family)